MSFARKVERQRDVNKSVELRRKLRLAAARRAHFAVALQRSADGRAQVALRASARNT